MQLVLLVADGEPENDKVGTCLPREPDAHQNFQTQYKEVSKNKNASNHAPSWAFASFLLKG